MPVPAVDRRPRPALRPSAGAHLAAEAALAAQDQGKFWELHDMMMTNQQDPSRDALIAYAGQVGIDVPSFPTALDVALDPR